MNKNRILATLILIAAHSAVAETGHHLFILSGQSNMEGLNSAEYFNPIVEKEFGKDNVIVVRDAKGGQPISRWYKDWKPGKSGKSVELDGNGMPTKENGELYDQLMAKVFQAAKGKQIQTVTFLWMQGEKDAKFELDDVYADSLKGFIEQVASDFGAKGEDINVVIGRLSDAGLRDDFPAPQAESWKRVREIQVEIAEAHPRGAWVNTDDLNDGITKKGKEIKDDLHYTVEGYRIFGERLATEAIALIRNKPAVTVNFALDQSVSWETKAKTKKGKKKESRGRGEQVDEAIHLHRLIGIPTEFLQTKDGQTFGGDCRIGDLTGNGVCDFVVYRSMQGGTGNKSGGLKPCFIAAFDIDGKPLWQQGNGGDQPVRPGPVAVHDFDGDGRAEIACLWHRPEKTAPGQPDWLSLADVVIQIRDGRTGRVLREAASPEITSRQASNSKDSKWAHLRILIANFRGLDRPRDMLIKIGDTIVVLTDQLDVLWTYQPQQYKGSAPPKFPAVGDMDGDGRDEVNGGYFLLSHEGKPYWENKLAKIMDSVAIERWDGNHIRAICSGGGHVMGFDAQPILKLDDKVVPHGQELRVADFISTSPGSEMAIRYKGHRPELIVVSNQGKVIRDLELNDTPNHTGMESVHFHGPGKPALLFNGSHVWNLAESSSIALPDLPPANGAKAHRMGFYHATPADFTGDGNEDLCIYDPTATSVFIFSADTKAKTARQNCKFTAGPRQYNPRLMD